jgi:hypothetical protein
MVQGVPSAIFFMVSRRILPERVFSSLAIVIASLKAATGPIFSRIEADAFLLDLGDRPVHTRLEHDEAAGDSRP